MEHFRQGLFALTVRPWAMRGSKHSNVDLSRSPKCRALLAIMNCSDVTNATPSKRDGHL
jgi:hypothetical protein